MASNTYTFTSINGGTGSLKNKDGANLATGDSAYVGGDGYGRLWELSATSGAAESIPSIVEPVTNAGNKRWLLRAARHEIDILMEYGGGVNFTKATIDAALTAIGTATYATIFLRAGTWVINAAADWSAYPKVRFKFAMGATLSHSTHAITFSGRTEISAGLWTIFDGTGAVTGLHNTVYIEWFGAVGNSATDDDAVAFKKACDSIASGGGKVVLSTIYYFATNTVVTGDDVCVEWLPEAEIKWNGANTGVVLNIRNPAAATVQYRNNLINPKITHVTTMANGSAAIGYYYCNSFHVEKPYIKDAFNPFIFTASGDGKVEDFHIVDTVAGGTVMALVSVADFSIKRGTAQGAVGLQPTYGITVNEVSGALDISEIDFFQQGQGLLLKPASTKVIMAVNADKCRFDSGTYGIVFSGTDTGLIWDVNVTNSWTSSNTNHGVLLEGPETMDYADIRFIGHQSALNGKDGLRMVSPTAMEDIQIIGGTFSGNSTASAGTYSGITVSGDIGNFRILGAKAGQVTALSGLSNNDQNYGIDIQTGAGSNFVVMGNDLTGNTNGALANTATGTGQIVKDNIGATYLPTLTQPNVVAKTTAITLDITELNALIVTGTHTTGSTIAYTLPTGTDAAAGGPVLNVGDGFDWHLINLSAAALDTITLTANTDHTIVGNPIVQSAHSSTGGIYGSSATFRTVKTAATTFITYRIS